VNMLMNMHCPLAEVSLWDQHGNTKLCKGMFGQVDYSVCKPKTVCKFNKVMISWQQTSVLLYSTSYKYVMRSVIPFQPLYVKWLQREVISINITCKASANTKNSGNNYDPWFLIQRVANQFNYLSFLSNHSKDNQ
jgi:hypothetical protein